MPRYIAQLCFRISRDLKIYSVIRSSIILKLYFCISFVPNIKLIYKKTEGIEFSGNVYLIC